MLALLRLGLALALAGGWEWGRGRGRGGIRGSIRSRICTRRHYCLCRMYMYNSDNDRTRRRGRPLGRGRSSSNDKTRARLVLLTLAPGESDRWWITAMRRTGRRFRWILPSPGPSLPLLLIHQIPLRRLQPPLHPAQNLPIGRSLQRQRQVRLRDLPWSPNIHWKETGRKEKTKTNNSKQPSLAQDRSLLLRV